MSLRVLSHRPRPTMIGCVSRQTASLQQPVPISDASDTLFVQRAFIQQSLSHPTATQDVLFASFTSHFPSGYLELILISV